MKDQTHHSEVVQRLIEHGINPTSQRVEIAQVLLARFCHMSADEVFHLVNKDQPQVSKATVYNTLGLFAEKGLIREVIVDPTKVFYDSNVGAHHHMYNVSTGELSDIDDHHMKIVGLPPLPPGTEVEGMEVVVRVRSMAGARAEAARA